MSGFVLDRLELHSRLKMFKAERAEEYHLKLLGYFGSYARNQAGDDSDVDIVFDTDAPNLFRAVVMKQELEQLLGRSVDMLQLRGLTNAGLKARIENEAIYV